MNDAQQLARIRADFAEIDARDWTRVEDGAGGFVEATPAFGGKVVLLRFDAVATPAEKQFVTDCVETVRFLLGLVDRAIEKLKPPPPERDTSKDYAAEAGIKCGEGAFKVFLEQQHGLERPLTDERTAQKVRTLLGVTSRKELNSDDVAAARWKKLRGEYDAWRRAER